MSVRKIILWFCGFCASLPEYAQFTLPKINVRIPKTSTTQAATSTTATRPRTSTMDTEDGSKAYTFCSAFNDKVVYITPVFSYAKDTTQDDITNRTAFRRLAEAWRDYVNKTLHSDGPLSCNGVPTTERNMAAYRQHAIDNLTRTRTLSDVNWSFDPAQHPIQVASLPPATSVAIPNFKSEEAKACWTYFFGPSPVKNSSDSEAAVAACKKAGNTGPPAEPKINPFRGDPVAQTALGISYITGNGVAIDRAQGLQWLLVAARGGGGWASSCDRPVFPPAMMMAGVLLWNKMAWWNTDTGQMVWAQPGDRWTNARKWISMNQGREFVNCASKSGDESYAQVAEQLKKQMPNSAMPLYDPRTSGTSTTHLDVGRFSGENPDDDSPLEKALELNLVFSVITAPRTKCISPTGEYKGPPDVNGNCN